jgi:long-subunit acyl-CoA synthetase (AMP-forming)
LGEYQFTTYREACARIDAIGRGLLSLGAKHGDRVLIFAETRPEWLVINCLCSFSSWFNICYTLFHFG